EELELGRFPGTVDPLDRDQPARVGMRLRQPSAYARDRHEAPVLTPRPRTWAIVMTRSPGDWAAPPCPGASGARPVGRVVARAGRPGARPPTARAPGC